MAARYLPDLSALTMEEVDAYALPIYDLVDEVESHAMKLEAKARAATSLAAESAYQRQAREAWERGQAYRTQLDPFVDEWARRGYPQRVTRTRAQFVKTNPRELVTFPEGRAPVVAPRPKGMSKKAYFEHIDRAGKVILTWRLAEDDGRRFEDTAADAISARAFWTSNDEYNHRNPGRSSNRVYLSARWVD